MAFPLSITQTLTTKVSPAAVWRALEEVQRWPEVLPAIAEVTLEPPGRLAAGSLIHARAVPLSGTIDMTYRVDVAEPPSRLVLTIDDNDFHARTEYRIDIDDDGATEVVVTSRLDAIGFGQSIRFLLWRARLMPMLTANVRDRAQAMLTLAERIAHGSTPW